MSGAVRKTVLKESLEGGPESDPENEAQQEEMPRKYIFLTIFSCFCPSYPINIVAFVFSMMALHSYNEGDIDGGKKLAHIATLVAIAAIIVGLLIIAISCIVHFTVENCVFEMLSDHPDNMKLFCFGMLHAIVYKRRIYSMIHCSPPDTFEIN